MNCQSVLKFAIVCNDLILANWQVKCIQSLLKSDRVKLSLALIDTARTSDEKKETCLNRLSPSRFQYKIFEIYKRYFLKSQAFYRVHLREPFPEVTIKECDLQYLESPLNKFLYEIDSNESCSRTRTFDFILWFGAKKLSRLFLELPRYGVWSFSIGGNSIYGGDQTCFWEILRSDPVITANLFRISPEPEQVCLLRTGVFKTQIHSPSRNLDKIYFECAKWPAYVCNKILHTSNWDVNQSPSELQLTKFGVPTNSQTLSFFKKILWSKCRKGTRSLCESEDWNIGVVEQPICSFLNPKLSKKISWIPKPDKNTFYADPFTIKKDDANYIFFEEFDYKTHSKWISYLRLNGQIDASVIRDSGLIKNTSYPYLIDYQGEIYCIPEAWYTKEIVLFKAVDFPSKWEKVCVLIENVSGVDSTVFRYSDLWWIAATIREEDPNLKLFLWYADSLFGPYQPHLTNPVKIDVRSSRPAGTPFVHDSKLYRPAQDCSRTYGGGIVINVIKELTPVEFREEVATVIKSDGNVPYTDGIHTITAAGNITIIDGKRHIFNMNALKHVLMKRFTKKKYRK